MVDQFDSGAFLEFKGRYPENAIGADRFFQPKGNAQVRTEGSSESFLVSRDQAMNILKQYLGVEKINVYNISDSPPEKCQLWGLPEGADCWYITLSYYPNHHMLQSGRLICISKDTGVILYDGACINGR